MAEIDVEQVPFPGDENIVQMPVAKAKQERGARGEGATQEPVLDRIHPDVLVLLVHVLKDPVLQRRVLLPERVQGAGPGTMVTMPVFRSTQVTS